MKARQQPKARQADAPQNSGSPTHGVHATWRHNRYGLVRCRISITFEDSLAFWRLWDVFCRGLAPATVDERHEVVIVVVALWGLQHVIEATLLALGSEPIGTRAAFLELKRHLARLSPEEQAIFRVGNDARRRLEALQARRRSAAEMGAEAASARQPAPTSAAASPARTSS